MRKILSVLLVLSLLAPSNQAAQAVEKAEPKWLEGELWQLYMARAVAYQPASVGAEAFLGAFGLKPYTGAGRELYRDAKGVEAWPVARVEGRALRIGYEGSAKAVTIELGREGGLLVNGRPFSLDRQKPVLPQVQRFLEEALPQAVRSRSFSFSLPFVSEAQAAEDSLPRAVPMRASRSQAAGQKDAEAEKASKHGGLGTMSVGIGLGVAVVAGALLVAAAAPATGLVVGGGGVALGVTSMAAGFLCGGSGIKGDSAVQRFLNCSSQPLSWVGKNPRDRLYLKGIECGAREQEGRIRIWVKSLTGIEQVRTFRHEGDLLAEAVLDDGEGHSTHLSTGNPPQGKRFEEGETAIGKRIRRPRHAKKLDEAQQLFADFHYLRGLCKEPDRVQEVQRAVARGAESVRVYDHSSPADLNKGAEDAGAVREAK